MSWTDRWREEPRPRGKAELAKFGVVMATAFGLLGALLLWRGRPAGDYLLWIGGGFLGLAVVAPVALGPVERAWLWVGERLGRVMTAIIVALTYFLVITPIGLIRRVVSGDTLGLKPDRSALSHWVPVERDGPASRPTKPF